MTVVSALLLAMVGFWRHDDAVLAAGVNPPTPGNFTGYGFDQCTTPSQASMDAWLAHSQYLGVGVYISGVDRGCPSQPNLTPEWVSTQLANGWHILPIDVGPQAACYQSTSSTKKVRISTAKNAGGGFGQAIKQAKADADDAVAAALALGIRPKSTIYYDIEAYDTTKGPCNNSALAFLSAWTNEIHAQGYKSGVYSSALAAIRALDRARKNNPGRYTMPDHLWIADWDGLVNTESSHYAIDPTAWVPHARIKQYRGGHNETHGGVTINIDNDYLNVGHGTLPGRESHCGGVPINFPDYLVLSKPSQGHKLNANQKAQVKALKCLLKERGTFTAKPANARWGKSLVRAINDWKTAHPEVPSQPGVWNRPLWMSIFAAGPALNGTSTRYLKYGSGGSPVRDLQRALNAAIPGIDQKVDGLFYAVTTSTLKTYEKQVGIKAEGIVSPTVWEALAAGRLTEPSPPTTCPTPSPTISVSPTASITSSASPSISPTASTSPQPPTTCPTTSPTVTTTTPAAKKPAAKHATKTKKTAAKKR